MTVHNTKPSVLKVKGGKYVTVWQYKDGLKLCVRDMQIGITAPKVNIYTRPVDNKIQMAFSFHRADHFRVPKVGNMGITLELFASCDNQNMSSLPDEYWFEKIDVKAGEHYALRSVGETQQYLSISETVIVCRSEQAKCGHFTDKSSA